MPAGSELGIPVTVLMPTIAPLTKVERCRRLGANVVLHGDTIADAKQEALENPLYEGMCYVNGYDDADIIAGAGTLGVEVADDAPPDLDAVVVPVGHRDTSSR